MHRLITGLCYICSIFGTIPSEASAEPYSVKRYTAAAPGPVNTWWVETPGGGLIVVDAQRDPMNAQKAVDAIKTENKPVRAILITHPHPDHVTGLQTFHDAFPDAVIYAQRGTAAEMKADTQSLLKASAKQLGISSLKLPDPIILAERAPISIDGLKIDAASFGESESVASSVYYMPDGKLLISGDIVTVGLVPFLAEGRARKWLAQVQTLTAAYPSNARILPGHGDDGDLKSMAEAQRVYLTTYLDKITQALGKAGDTKKDGEIAVSMPAGLNYSVGVAGMPLDKLKDLNAKAVRRELETGESGLSPSDLK